jgi:serine phosphatase RsbU (regulator of sigma subunit)/anti-sigma regulatory factor (Ser/Thr protein kinase)
MPRLDERERSSTPGERTLDSIRAVMARMTDVLWEADAGGDVTRIVQCRPAAPSGEGELDETEVRRLEQLWRKCARCAERFSAFYHIRSPGVAPRTFLVRAIPVLDERDRVLYWSGISAETDGLAEADTRFISEAAAVLSSSLNRTTIVNRLVQASVDHFCDLCAVHTFDDNGSATVEGIAVRRGSLDVGAEALEDGVQDAVRARQPLLIGRTERARSTIVVPLSAGAGYIGAVSFLESERLASFAPRDLEVAVVVARQLAMALENIKTFERERDLTHRFRFLAQVTESLFATLDPAKMLELLLATLCNNFADYGIAAAVSNGQLRVLAAVGTKARFREGAEREIVAALQMRRSILIAEPSDADRRPELIAGPLYEPTHPRSWMMVPLFAGDATFGALLCCSSAHCYDAGELELVEEIGRRASLALEHAESFARERRLIQTLQQATLPTRLATVEGATLSAVYRPAASELQVGGDWYDAFDLDDHRVLLTVGDVMGHGLEASIVMGKLRHAINVVAMYEPDPARILDAAERILLRRYPDSVATAFAAIFDSRRRTITYANAGHPYPFVRSNDGSLTELEADGLPLGLRSVGPKATSKTQQLDNASLLAFYTDGLTEATRDMLAGERLLREALGTDAVFYVKSPAKFLENFCLDEQSPDDVAILLLNFVESQRWTFDSSDWRAARRVRREVLANLEACAEPGSDLKAAELIFGELAANAAQHAGGPIDVALEWRDRAAVLHLIDRGEGYTTAEEREADLLTEHGRGLWLVQRLGAELTVEPLPGFGTHVRAVLPITSATISSP